MNNGSGDLLQDMQHGAEVDHVLLIPRPVQIAENINVRTVAALRTRSDMNGTDMRK